MLLESSESVLFASRIRFCCAALSTGFLVDQFGSSLHSSLAGETTDGALGDPLDVITEDLAVALGSSLAETLSSFPSTGC